MFIIQQIYPSSFAELSLHLLVASMSSAGKPLWGTELRIELVPALQQVHALLTEFIRTPLKTYAAPSELRCTLKRHASFLKTNAATSELRRTLRAKSNCLSSSSVFHLSFVLWLCIPSQFSEKNCSFLSVLHIIKLQLHWNACSCKINFQS